MWLEPRQAFLAGFILAAMSFALALPWRRRARQSQALRQTAARDDAGRALILLVSILLAGVVLAAVGLELPRARDGAALALAVGALLSAWLFGNLAAALHYAHVYYDVDGTTGQDRGGLAFPGTPDPEFPDFCYFAFVLGMTFQVSDVAITDTGLRRLATVHGIVAFLFNVGVIALSVSLVGAAISPRG